jgi:hypothetical protein
LWLGEWIKSVTRGRICQPRIVTLSLRCKMLKDNILHTIMKFQNADRLGIANSPLAGVGCHG